jgi:hypothetical protein
MADIDELSPLERHARAVLQESLAHVDARTRSRLNRARQSAVNALPAQGWRFARGLRLMPVTGAVAAAVLIALVLLGERPRQLLPTGENAQPSIEVLDMLADEDGPSLVEDEDHSFYEWAAAQEAPTDASASNAEASG